MKNSCRLIYTLIFFTSINATAKVDLYGVTNPELKNLPIYTKAKVEEQNEQFRQVGETDSKLPINIIYFPSTIAFPAGLVLQQGQSESAEVKIEAGGSNVSVTAESLDTVLDVTSAKGGKIRLLLSKTFDDAKIVYNECEGKKFPELVLVGEEKPKTAIGFSCIDVPGKEKSIVISVPKEAEIVSSSFFDVQGKGERWRLYSLPYENRAGAVMGFVVVRYKGKDFKYEVRGTLSGDVPEEKIQEVVKENKVLKKQVVILTKQNKELMQKKEEERKPSLFDLTFGFGMDSLAMNSTDETLGSVSKSGAGIVASFYGKSNLIKEKYTISVGSSTTLPLSKDESRVEHFEFNSSLGYLFLGKPWSLSGVMLASYRSFMNPGTGLAIQVGHFGFGVEGEYALSNTDRILYLVGMQPLGSDVMKGHTLLRLGYMRTTDWFMNANIGGSFEMQKIEVVNKDGLPKDASSMVLSLLVGL